MSKLEIALLTGDASKTWLVEFTKQVDRLEKILAKLPKGKADADTDNDDEEKETPAIAPKKRGRPPKVKTPEPEEDEEDEDEADEEVETESDDEDADEDADDDEDESDDESDDDEDGDDDDSDDDDEAEVKKPAPKKKLPTKDEVLAACVLQGKRFPTPKEGMKAIKKALRKQFGSESVSDIDPKDYADAIRVVQAVKVPE